jgi:putative hemolysin
MLLVIFLTLIFSAFFSGMEIAFVSSNRLKIEIDNKQGKFSAKLLSKFFKHESKFIGAMLVGNNIALVIYGVYMADLLAPFIEKYIHSELSIILLQTLLSTLLVLIAAEFLPKAIFRINPNKALDIFAIPVNIIYFILFPIVMITIGISNVVLKYIFKVPLINEETTFGKIDIDNYIKEATNNNQSTQEVEHEVQIFQNALDFSQIKVRECMIPRKEIVAMNFEDDIRELKEKFIETGFSKILIYKETVDNIIGYTHSYELFKKPDAIKNILLPVTFIPETMSANEALKHLLKQKKSIAVVLDEFGGTSGMLTLEDVVEEIFGDIEDEHDDEKLLEEKIDEQTFKFSARLEIDYLNQTHKINLPETNDYETLAGLIIHHSQNIPQEGETVKIGDFTFNILKVEDNRIDEVKLFIEED